MQKFVEAVQQNAFKTARSGKAVRRGKMSGLPTVNVVDDEEMSSEGSVNAPVAPPRSPSVHSTRVQSPIEPVDFSGGRISPVAKTLQIEKPGPRGSSSMFSPVQSTEIIGAPTVPVDIPTREDTDTGFCGSFIRITQCVDTTR